MSMRLGPKKMTEQEDIPIREFLERILNERDRLYTSKFEEAKTALNAHKEAVASNFVASEKAIIKAEEAQREYNARSNEFRGQLDDQAKTLMARQEALALFKSHDDKVETMRAFFDSKLETQRLAFEKTLDGLGKEIASLRESRSEVTGKTTNTREALGYVVAAGGIALAIIFHFVK